MTDRRKKLMAKLITANPTESEQKMTQLVMERICLDMCDFYDKFYDLPEIYGKFYIFVIFPNKSDNPKISSKNHQNTLCST